MRGVALAIAAAACGAASAAPPAASQDEKLAAIQKAMNDLAPAANQCWAAAAAERFDIAGQIAFTIDVAAKPAVTVARDTTKSPKIAACMIGVLGAYRWAPPLRGETIQLPFEFHAPQGQSVIDRRLVPWATQGKLSVAVLLDEANTGNAAASMFELAIPAEESSGFRQAPRAELWYFLGDAMVSWGPPEPKPPGHHVARGDMMFVPAGAERVVFGEAYGVHAVIVTVPGGREGAARTGALPTPFAIGRKSPLPVLLPAAGAKTFGPATIFLDSSIVKAAPLAASILAMPAGLTVPEHVHAHETELLYVLEGAGTMTIAGTQVAIEPTSVIQIPPNTKHSFTATAPVRAVQIYTPAGPEQRFRQR